jgi:hypothetical protein
MGWRVVLALQPLRREYAWFPKQKKSVRVLQVLSAKSILRFFNHFPSRMRNRCYPRSCTEIASVIIREMNVLQAFKPGDGATDFNACTQVPMNRVFCINTFFPVPDGTLVSPFLNPKDNKSRCLSIFLTDSASQQA